MRQAMLVAVIVVASAGSGAGGRCPGVYFDDKYYIPEVLKEGLNNARAVTTSRRDLTLYMTCDDLAPAGAARSQVAWLRLESGAAGALHGVPNATSSAVDPASGRVFVGGARGLYELDKFQTPQKLRLDDDVRSLFFRRGLYYTNARREAYSFVNGLRATIPELEGYEMDSLVLDEDQNVFFVRDQRVYGLVRGRSAVTEYDRYHVTSLSTDVYYRPYITTPQGVYSYNKYKWAWDRVCAWGGVRALAFSPRNEPLLVVGDALLRLVYNPEPCRELD